MIGAATKPSPGALTYDSRRQIGDLLSHDLPPRVRLYVSGGGAGLLLHGLRR